MDQPTPLDPLTFSPTPRVLTLLGRWSDLRRGSEPVCADMGEEGVVVRVCSGVCVWVCLVARTDVALFDTNLGLSRHI